MLHEYLNEFRDRGMEIVRKIPREAKSSKAPSAKLSAYLRWFQIPQFCAEMEDPLRHVTGSQSKDASVDITFFVAFTLWS